MLKNEHTSDVETSRPLLLLQSSSVVAFEPQRIIENCPISIVIVWAGAASGQLLFSAAGAAKVSLRERRAPSLGPSHSYSSRLAVFSFLDSQYTESTSIYVF